MVSNYVLGPAGRTPEVEASTVKSPQPDKGYSLDTRAYRKYSMRIFGLKFLHEATSLWPLGCRKRPNSADGCTAKPNKKDYIQRERERGV